jgi:hypothetical protein
MKVTLSVRDKAVEVTPKEFNDLVNGVFLRLEGGKVDRTIRPTRIARFRKKKRIRDDIKGQGGNS